MSVATGRSQLGTGTSIEWRQPGAGEILVTAHGELDSTSRSLLRSIILRAIALQPRRIVVTMEGSKPFDSVSRDLIAGIAKRARLARVSLVVVEETERVF